MAEGYENIYGELSTLNTKLNNIFKTSGDISSGNINTFTTTGIYQAWCNSTLDSVIGNSWGVLIVLHENPLVIEQVLITQNGIGKRHYEGGNWTSWKKVAFS